MDLIELMMRPNVCAAMTFASAAHGDQQRKYTGEPYLNHCTAVALLVALHVDYEPCIMAAALHDVIEDTTATYQDVKDRFGKEVADLVMEVTDVAKPDDGNRAERKRIELMHLSKSSFYGASIKLADLIDNTKTITDHDPNFAKVYLKEKCNLLEVLKHGDKELWRLANLSLIDGIKKLEALKVL